MPRKVDIARRRDIALRAFEVIKTRGVYRTSMSDIAGELGMKRPTLYWYFKDFGEIFDAVVSDTDRELEAFVISRLAGVDHPIDTLEALIEAANDFFTRFRDRTVVLFQLWVVTGEAARERIERRSRELIAPVRRELVARLTRGIDDGLVAPCDPEMVVDLALAVLDGAHVQRVTRQADPRRTLDGLRRHVLDPLRLPPPGEPS